MSQARTTSPPKIPEGSETHTGKSAIIEAKKFGKIYLFQKTREHRGSWILAKGGVKCHVLPYSEGRVKLTEKARVRRKGV